MDVFIMKLIKEEMWWKFLGISVLYDFKIVGRFYICVLMIIEK